MKYFALLLLFACAHQAPSSKKYVRQDWPHWSDEDNNCLNTRHEILRKRSVGGVSYDRKGCHVIRGRWDDYYYPEQHKLAREVDIDHLVPLKHAHDHGAANWSTEEKERFANDPENLVITNKSYNRQKGPKSIAEWLPVHKEYACKYMHDWMKIKAKYHLTVDSKETAAIKASGCPGF